jgi:hypothetical protein
MVTIPGSQKSQPDEKRKSSGRALLPPWLQEMCLQFCNLFT